MIAASIMRNRNEIWQEDRIRFHGEAFLIVAEQHNLVWLESELDIFLKLWKEGKCVTEIAETLKRPEYEVGYLLIYLDTPTDDQQSKQFKAQFKRRKSGVFAA